MPIEVTKLGVDFLATSGYKWLLSPISTGFLYVKKDLLDELWPTIIGYRADEHYSMYGYREFQPARTARRYEDGQLNFPGFSGMKEAIGLLQEVGLENVWQRILSLVDRLRIGLQHESKVRLESHIDEDSKSGILSLGCKGPETVADRLLEKRIVVSVREGRLRISPHFYNTEAEIDMLVSELKAH